MSLVTQYSTNLTLCYQRSGADEQEHATPLYFCNGVFIDRFMFKSNLLWMRLPWECHNQSQDTNWRHCVLDRNCLSFTKEKVYQKIDQSIKMPWHRLSMGVASSCSSAPATVYWHWFCLLSTWVKTSEIETSRENEHRETIKLFCIFLYNKWNPNF